MIRRTARVAALWLLLGAGLGGCANLSFLAPPPEPEPAPEPAAGAEPAIERAVYRLEVVAPDELKKLLTDYLDLARFQSAPEAEGITTAELDRLVAATPAQARALLETEGYFQADVQATKVAGGDGLPLIHVSVEPGERVRVGEVTLEATGPLQDAAQAGDADAVGQLDALRRQWPLSRGRGFAQSAWSSAKATTLARLRAQGYPAAEWRSTDARVDVQANRAQLHLVLASGPLFRLGPLRIEGLQRYDAASVERLATFSPGQPYSEQALLDFQERLQRVGLFDGAVVEIDANPETAAAAPVQVRVTEAPLQAATVGVGYSANTRARVTLEHVHRRVFGTRWVAKNKFELGTTLRSWQGDLTSHPLDDLYRNLVSGSAERLDTADEVRTSWSARLGRTQDTQRMERLYFAEYTQSRLHNAAGLTRSDAVSGNYHWIWRDLDSVLLPTDGSTLSAQAALGYAMSSSSDRGPFGRALVRYTWYRPLGQRWYATARVEAGQVFARESLTMPDTLLFRAGGDDSVRGYAYRTLGPSVDGVLSSGRVLLTGSFEVARPISRRRPAFWWAAFVDAGNAALRWDEMDPALGYGVGLRWRSPVGPLRLDLAYGQEVRKARLHFSVGIAF